MLFSRRSATSACAIVLIVMAVTPYHRFSSSIGLVSGAMTWLVILGACLAAFGHGVALRKGREIRRPGFLGAFGIFLAAIAAVPEWADLAFYARGDSIPFVFAPIWRCMAFRAPRALLGRCSSHMLFGARRAFL